MPGYMSMLSYSDALFLIDLKNYRKILPALRITNKLEINRLSSLHTQEATAYSLQSYEVLSIADRFLEAIASFSQQ
jgi:hypothetical protein